MALFSLNIIIVIFIIIVELTSADNFSIIKLIIIIIRLTLINNFLIIITIAFVKVFYNIFNKKR